jgi:hypothetical protein
MTQTHVKITTTRIFSGQTLTFQVKINNDETEAIQRLNSCNNVEIRDVKESSIGRITTSGTIHIDSRMRERIQLSISQREIDYIRQDPNYEHEIEYQHQMSDQRRIICIWKQTKDQTKTEEANTISTTDLKINEMITQLRQDLNRINDTLTRINDDLNDIREHENSIDEKMREIEQQTMIANNQIPEIMQTMKENVKLIQSGTDTIETQTNRIQQNLITSLTKLETKLTAEITAHLALTRLEQNQHLYSDIIISANIGDCHNELTALTSAGAPSSGLEQWDDTSFELISKAYMLLATNRAIGAASEMYGDAFEFWRSRRQEIINVVKPDTRQVEITMRLAASEENITSIRRFTKIIILLHDQKDKEAILNREVHDCNIYTECPSNYYLIGPTKTSGRVADVFRTLTSNRTGRTRLGLHKLCMMETKRANSL